MPRNAFTQALVKGGVCFACLTTILLVLMKLKGGIVKKLKSAMYISKSKSEHENSYVELYCNIEILLLKHKLVIGK